MAVVEQCGVPQQQIVLNLSLGRGVSYYTGLVFEIHARDEDGFDAQLCGGGRYDHLVRAVGGNRDINACGFAFGIERLLSLIDRSDLPSNESTRALVIPVSQSDVPYALQVARSTRLQGLWTEVDVSGHGVGAGLKIATRKQIALAIIVGESEQRTQRVTLKDLQTGEERVLAVDTLAENIAHKEQWQ